MYQINIMINATQMKHNYKNTKTQAQITFNTLDISATVAQT